MAKRYYYERFDHKMLNSFGHAKDFFNPNVTDGKLNTDRNFLQFKNGSTSIPKKRRYPDFYGNMLSPYGYVAIIYHVGKNYIEFVQ